MTRILRDAGAQALHRSMPYEGGPFRHWPTDRDFDGFDPDWLVIMVRDREITVRSQLRANHVESEGEARTNIDEAYLRLKVWADERNVPSTFVDYEGLVENPTKTIDSVCALLGIDPPAAHEEVYDGNAKYQAAG